MDQEAHHDDLDGRGGKTATGSRQRVTSTYQALLARYRPAYAAATNLNVAAWVFVAVGVVGTVMGLFWFDGNGFKQAMAPLLVGCGFFSVVAGFILSMLASLLRAVLDRTAFVAPELDEADRVRLAFEAGGEQAPIRK